MGTLFLLLSILATGNAIRYPQAGLPHQVADIDFSSDGDELLASTVLAANNAVRRQQAGTPDIAPIDAQATPHLPVDTAAGTSGVTRTGERDRISRTDSVTSTSSTDTTTTTDEILHALTLPAGYERNAIFHRIDAALDTRSGRIFAPPGTGTWYQPRSTKQTASQGTQTYISLPEHLPPRKEKAITATLHADHRNVGEHRSGAAYTDHNPALHIRDFDTTNQPRQTGTMYNPPWPNFMRHLVAETQTPIGWTHTRAPATQGYVQVPPLHGIHGLRGGVTWIPIPSPVHPYIPSAADEYGIRAATAPYATIIPAYHTRRGPR